MVLRFLFVLIFVALLNTTNGKSCSTDTQIECVKNCTCTDTVWPLTVCTNANFDDVISYVQKLQSSSVLIIKQTPIHHLKKLPELNIFHLEISNCEVSVIDENAFNQLKYLWNLNLDNNLLTELPKLMDEMKELYSFTARNNKISKVNPDLFSGSAVKNIDFSHNLLTDIEFLKYTKSRLLFLELSHNLLEHVILDEFSKLYDVGLAHNKLQGPNSVVLTKARKLGEVDLSENYISTMDAINLTGTHYIRHLYLQKNRLRSDVALNFTEHTYLQRVNLDDNEITTLPILPMDISTLSLKNNKLDVSKLNFPQHGVNNVSLAGNELQTLNKNEFANLESICIVNLLNNDLKFLDHQSQECKTKLYFDEKTTLHIKEKYGKVKL